MSEAAKMLEQDIGFLLKRQERAGRFSLDCKERDTGISSNALIRYAYVEYSGISGPEKSEYPADTADLAACFRAYEKLPAHRQTAEVLLLLAGYVEHVAERRPNDVHEMLSQNFEWEEIYYEARRCRARLEGKQ